MALTPRITLEDSYVQGMKCAICGNPDLVVVHVAKYPDFVSCNLCGAAFVVENEGSWVMYGKIPADYPETNQFALRQWTWLDAVAHKAKDEREAKSPPSIIPQEPIEQPIPTPSQAKEGAPTFFDKISTIQESETLKSPPAESKFQEEKISEEVIYSPPTLDEFNILEEAKPKPLIQDEEHGSLSEDFPELEKILAASLPESIDLFETKEEDQANISMEERLFPELKILEDETKEEIAAPTPDLDFQFPEKGTLQREIVQPISIPEKPVMDGESAKIKPSTAPVGEPEPDKRFRVTVQGSPPKYPQNYCAHCLRTPVKTKAVMRGSLPDPNHPGKRKLIRMELPFCKDCQKRMNAKSDDEKNAKLISFLISGLIALVAIIVTLAFGLVDLKDNLLSGSIILIVIAILGFSIPLMISLTWAGQNPPPRDAAFVLSTLLVSESGEDRTDFEWRNPGYAELFRQVNQERTIGRVLPIQDRITFLEVQPEKIEPSEKNKTKPKPPKKSKQEEVLPPDTE